jgi:hypothetical protein
MAAFCSVNFFPEEMTVPGKSSNNGISGTNSRSMDGINQTSLQSNCDDISSGDITDNNNINSNSNKRGESSDSDAAIISFSALA